MKQQVIKIDGSWQYCPMPMNEPTDSVEFDEASYLLIAERIVKQVCVLRNNDKYGIYCLDHTDGMGGTGTWCTPTSHPFPYDEVKVCLLPFLKDYALFAFRINNKWGIIKIADSYESNDHYDVEYGITKCRTVVPCEYSSLTEAERKLDERTKWLNPFEMDDW